MATHLQNLRRAGALALLLAIAGTPAWAAAGPSPRPAVQAEQMHAPSAEKGGAGADDSMPGIIPIGLGLLLTGIACYKHRGLPSSGH
ncbi:hypothetical protein ACEZCY_25610 [Streptacidiphilus sp. N1-12]|uniref:MYXO-CTERM domain-containing protein n=2 Tax=Streptacidiphilus alkalitolerans TaxID=3342712 RepID=A0ABV6WKM0_9ACTN